LVGWPAAFVPQVHARSAWPLIWVIKPDHGNTYVGLSGIRLRFRTMPVPLETNPFAVLTFIAAPAVLTNASSVLALGTSNRFARNVDRMRTIIKVLDDPERKTSPAVAEVDAMYRNQLGQYERRARLLVRALSSFYLSVGCFAAGSLTSLLGAVVVAAGADHPWLLRGTLGVALASGIAGLAGLIAGGVLLVRETRLALRTISDEADFYRTHFGGRGAAIE
jgi:hypothetical protein